MFPAHLRCSAFTPRANGPPPVCCAASGCTKSRMRGGFESSVYFLSCQLFTTAPRLENSTRYRSFFTTRVRSSASALGGVAGCDTPDTLVPGAFEPGVLLVGGAAAFGVLLPGVAGAVCAGRFACGRFVGGLGPKNLAQSRITTSERSEATTMRSSCVNLDFFSGSLKNGPLLVRLMWCACRRQERGRV